MEYADRKSVSDYLREYDFLAKGEDFIEVTEWANGEGWDITIGDKHVSLTMGELDAINYLTQNLIYSKKVNR